MPATLKSITSKANTVAVEIDGDPKGITVTYSTRRVTPQMMKTLQEALASGDDPSGMESIVDQFLTVATSWDLKPDVGEPVIALEKSALMNVSLEVLTMVMAAIDADQRPKEAIDGSSNTP